MNGGLLDGTGPPLLAIIDLQQVVLPGAPWSVPGVDKILPNVTALVRAFGAECVLTRHRLATGPGTWRRFGDRWSHLRSRPDLWQLTESVATAAHPAARIVDKTTYSAFAVLREPLEPPGSRPLVLAGCETDCCVVATMMAAVDAGVGVVLVEDALVGSDEGRHHAILAAAARLPEQVAILRTTDVLTAVR